MYSNKVFSFILGLLLGTALAAGLTAIANASTIKPKEPKEFKQVTVMVTNKEKSSGGSGVIYKSTDKGSLILTNSHVCELLKDGGLIVTASGDYVAERYKRSKNHDVCLVEVTSNLKTSTVLAKESTNFGDKVTVSGHPYLIPTTITQGYLSGLIEITLLVGTEKCTEEERERNGFLCFWFDGMPVIKTFPAQSSSVFIAPGNSGSAIFNESGEIVALAFAGISGGLSHGFLVPLEYIKAFLNKEADKLEWTEVNVARKYSETRRSSSNFIYDTKLNVIDNSIDKLAFPSIRDPKTEQLINKLDLCRKGLERCSKN